MASQLSTPRALSVRQISTQEIRTALSSTGHLFSLNRDIIDFKQKNRTALSSTGHPFSLNKETSIINYMQEIRNALSSTGHLSCLITSSAYIETLMTLNRRIELPYQVKEDPSA
jgi:hypothetical protein